MGPRVATLAYTSNSNTFQGLSRPNFLKFKDPRLHQLKHESRLIPSNLSTFSRQVVCETRNAQTAGGTCRQRNVSYLLMEIIKKNKLIFLAQNVKIQALSSLFTKHFKAIFFFSNSQGFQRPVGTLSITPATRKSTYSIYFF